jgi:hypothetical protein
MQIEPPALPRIAASSGKEFLPFSPQNDRGA